MEYKELYKKWKKKYSNIGTYDQDLTIEDFKNWILSNIEGSGALQYRRKW